MLMVNLSSSGAPHIHILLQFCNNSAGRLVILVAAQLKQEIIIVMVTISQCKLIAIKLRSV